MRLLFINPNTTQSITDKVAAVARSHARAGTLIEAVTGRFGAPYIAARAPYAIAAHAALDVWAHAMDGHDGVVLACFGDPGLDGLRELCEVPVIGLAEASLHSALQLGERVGIVTGGALWGPMLREFAAARGLADRVASIRTVAPSGADIARDPDASVAMLAQSCNEAAAEGAACVILGGAGLAGLAPRLAPLVSVPLIDCVVAGLRQAEALVGLASAAARGNLQHRAAPPGSAGLSDALARRLAETRR